MACALGGLGASCVSAAAAALGGAIWSGARAIARLRESSANYARILGARRRLRSEVCEFLDTSRFYFWAVYLFELSVNPSKSLFEEIKVQKIFFLDHSRSPTNTQVSASQPSSSSSPLIVARDCTTSHTRSGAMELAEREARATERARAETHCDRCDDGE